MQAVIPIIGEQGSRKAGGGQRQVTGHRREQLSAAAMIDHVQGRSAYPRLALLLSQRRVRPHLLLLLTLPLVEQPLLHLTLLPRRHGLRLAHLLIVELALQPSLVHVRAHLRSETSVACDHGG